jgi:putative phosphoesterase
MKLAVISDVHANLPALEAVLADIKARQVQALYCLGDLVGYAPWPNEVVQTVWAKRIPTLAGNYDEGVGWGSDNCGCAYRTDAERALGAQSIAYTNRVVTDEVRGYLRELPRQLRISQGALELLMVHGSPRRVNEYLFEDRPEGSLLRMMEHAGADVLLFGHTHKPCTRCSSMGQRVRSGTATPSTRARWASPGTATRGPVMYC